MQEQRPQLTKKERYELRRQEKIRVRQARRRKKKIRRGALWSLVVLAIGGGILGIVMMAARPSTQTASLTDAVSLADRFKGSEAAKVTLLEYSDFQCPACASYFPMVKQLIEEFGQEIKFVYRHFPLKQIHRNAELAARAAEAAGQQDKFWEMHDLLFVNQTAWADEREGAAEATFMEYADSLGLDLERFKQDLESDEIKEKVNKDYQTGFKAKVNSTPTFFLNGEKIQNPRNYDEFSELIKKALEETP